MSVWDLMPTCGYVANTGNHLSALWSLCETWCEVVGMLQILDTIQVRYDVCVRLDANLWVCCRYWTPSKCAMMSVWDLMQPCWYVADTGYHLSAPSCLCDPLHQLVEGCAHWTPTKCAMMSVWDLMLTFWYVADTGHHLSALLCLCETWCQPGHLLSAPWCPCEIGSQLVDMFQTLGTISVRHDVCVRLDLSLGTI